MELAPGVHSIAPTSEGLLKGGYVHAYLFEDDNELTLVDTGWDDDAHVILNYLSSIGRSVTDLKHIAITHAHRSHLGGLATLQGLSGAKVYAHREEAPIIAGRKRARPVSLNLRYLRPMVLYPFRLLALIDFPKHVPCQVTEVLGDYRNPLIGELKPIFTPGHTAGHLAFWHERHQVLVAGDAVATWPTFSAGWPGFNEDEKLYLDSLTRLINWDPRPQYVATGHGDPFENVVPTNLETLLPVP